MRANQVLGILYSNAYDSVLPEMTNLRTMGSVPFAGRYRLIDFTLSSMVNAGVSMVGVITKGNYRSLMDHLGTGKPWDLSRKNEGMFLLPPFSSSHSGGVYRHRMDALRGIYSFIRDANKEYVLLCDSNIVCNMDLSDMLERHNASGADISLAYREGKAPRLQNNLSLTLDRYERVIQCAFSTDEQTESAYSVNIILLKKALLERLIQESVSLRYEDFEQDILCANVGRLQIYGYRMQGFVRTVDSLQSYYDISMELLQSENRTALFQRARPIYTKVRDEVPAIYGLESGVSNSLVADGCKIEGRVENSILFRGTQVSRGTVVRDSIILQDSYIGEEVEISCVIMDKMAVVKSGRTLSGAVNYPLYVAKGIVI